MNTSESGEVSLKKGRGKCAFRPRFPPTPPRSLARAACRDPICKWTRRFAPSPSPVRRRSSVTSRARCSTCGQTDTCGTRPQLWRQRHSATAPQPRASPRSRPPHTQATPPRGLRLNERTRCMCTARALHVRCMCAARALHVRCMCTACAPHVRRMCTACAPHVHLSAYAHAHAYAYA